MYNILVADDDKEITESIKIFLQDEGYKVFTAYSGVDALNILKNEQIHLVLIDVMMPELDGISVTREIRKISMVPIIVISAKTQSTDKIIGLNAGADDYISKPFDIFELIARVKSNLRRYVKFDKKDDDTIVIDGLVINDKTKEVTVDGELIKLTALEYNILYFLSKNKGQVFSIKQIYENVWNEEFDGYDKKVVVHISHIRDKIEINSREPKYLKAIWGLGYKIENIKNR